MKFEFTYADGKPVIALKAETPDDSTILQVIGDKQPVSARVSNGAADSPVKALTIEFGVKG